MLVYTYHASVREVSQRREARPSKKGPGTEMYNVELAPRDWRLPLAPLAPHARICSPASVCAHHQPASALVVSPTAHSIAQAV